MLPYFTHRYNRRHYVTSLNLLTTSIYSGLLILLHGIKSLPDATSCDKIENFSKDRQYYQNVSYNPIRKLISSHSVLASYKNVIH